MPATRVLVAVEPRMYAEALAFCLRERRPRAEVVLLGPSGDVGAEARRLRPHLIVANRVPPGAKEGAFWVEVEEPRAGGGPETLGAEISAGGHPRSVGDVRVEHVIAALDRAEERLARGSGRAVGGSRGVGRP